MFANIKIEKSGKELRDACIATINRHELTPTLTPVEISVLEILSRNLTDSYRYELTIDEARFLGL
jgi:hypothetical protein